MPNGNGDRDEQDQVRQPEILPLPEPPTPPATPVSAFEEPFFSVLQREKLNYRQAFDNSRRNSRIERIRSIQELRDSKVIVYYSLVTLTSEDAEMLFDLLQSVGRRRNLDLFLLSPGGFIDPAFKMATLCREFVEERFAVLVPYYAKSAATLLCLGSDELVMGAASEIGPTDPRIEITDEYGRKLNVSATAVEDALKVIEEYTAGDPGKSLKYMPLLERINLNTLGEYRRALSSSKQYAEELLKQSRLLADKSKVAEVAGRLATGYFSHAYPINASVAATELKFNVANAAPQLWQAIWQLHKLYDAFIKDSAENGPMVTTIFEAEEFLLPISKQQQ